MKLLSLCFAILCSCSVLGQKIVEKSLLDYETEFIAINTENCYQINIKTAATSVLSVEAIIDGEYQDDLLLKVKEESNAVYVSAGFNPGFNHPNDKLSAHKVVSISLEITIPEHKNVKVYGASSNVVISGDYRDLGVSLLDGNCTLYNVGQLSKIKTQSGNITVFNTRAQIEASTKYGTISRDSIPMGENQFILSSTTGNIQLKKTK